MNRQDLVAQKRLEVLAGIALIGIATCFKVVTLRQSKKAIESLFTK